MVAKRKENKQKLLRQNINFSAGDFAFAKVKGHPAWPAKIYKYKNNKFHVHFYGTGETAKLTAKHLYGFEENKERFATAERMKRQIYREAMDQIEVAFHIRSSGNIEMPDVEMEYTDDDMSDTSLAEEATTVLHNIGDYVFAQAKGFQPWPAKILECNNKQYHVQFYGSGQKSHIKVKDVFTYKEYKGKLNADKNLEHISFNAAVEQMEAEMNGKDSGLNELPEVANETTKRKNNKNKAAVENKDLPPSIANETTKPKDNKKKAVIENIDLPDIEKKTTKPKNKALLENKDLPNIANQTTKLKDKTKTAIENKDLTSVVSETTKRKDAKKGVSKNIDLLDATKEEDEQMDVLENEDLPGAVANESTEQRKNQKNKKVTKNKEFNVDNLVFAKVKGYPAWPAIITECSDKKFNVCFYGTNERGTLKAENLFHYAENKEKFVNAKTLKRKDYSEAMEEVYAVLNSRDGVRK